MGNSGVARTEREGDFMYTVSIDDDKIILRDVGIETNISYRMAKLDAKAHCPKSCRDEEPSVPFLE